MIKSKFNQARAHSAHAGIIMDLLEELNTPRSIALAISFRHSGFKTVASELLELDPLSNSTLDYKSSAQAVAFFKKSTYLESDNDLLVSNSIASFLRLEEELKTYNLNRVKNSFYNSTIFTASRIMRRLLGPLPDVSDLKVSFTKGATYSLAAADATVAAKLSNRLDVTPLAKPYLLKWLGADRVFFDAYSDKKLITADGNKLSTVPKDFRKVRVICKEPLGNMILQRGFGLHMKNRLKTVGIFIETGQSDHKSLLKYDSDCWSTIDQSDASDRISRSLVKDLLPIEWYHVLDRIRSRKTLINGEWHELEKFMTQGNGFTFELETMIFYCLIQAMHINIHGYKTVVSVYGDDVIVPVHHGKTVVENLSNFGLTVNTEKSFVDGPFKESCGFDILEGKEVRPFYLKEFEPHDTIYYVQFCNFIKRVLDHHNSCGVYDLDDSRPWKRCLSYINESDRFFGPSSLGDNVIITSAKPIGYKHTYYKNGILHVRTYSRKYGKRSFIKPRGTGSEIAYALLHNSSAGNLKRGAGWKLGSAWAFPVNWN